MIAVVKYLKFLFKSVLYIIDRNNLEISNFSNSPIPASEGCYVFVQQSLMYKATNLVHR